VYLNAKRRYINTLPFLSFDILSQYAKFEIPNADDTRSRNRRQKPPPENWRRFLAPVFHASCKISGARNQHGRIKSNQTFYLAIRPTHVK